MTIVTGDRICGELCDASPRACRCKPSPSGGDPGFWEVHAELWSLHVAKAETYGTDQDALANYVQTSEAVGEPDEYTPALRIHEKLVRALNLIRAGRADEVREWLDIAALAVGAEALRRRRA